MKKYWLLLICFVVVQWTYAQSTLTIGVGSSVSVGSGDNVAAGYRDGTMTNTGYFNTRSITFDPVATAATSVSEVSFNANWNASSGASGYKLDISTVSNFSSFVSGYQNKDVGNITSFFFISVLSSATTYYYRVRAYDIDGITGYSNVIIVTTAPVAPVAATASNINEISFSANWASSTGANTYCLDVATDIDFTNLVTGWSNVNVGNVTTYSVATNLTANTTYYYRVRAANIYGTGNNSNIITVLTAPLPPVAVTATPISQTSFVAKWRTSVGATKYYLDVSLLSDFSTYVTGYQNLDVGSDTTYSVSSNISAGTTYYYRLRSNNGVGTSTNSNIINLITIPPNPTIADASNILSTSFDAKWNTSTSATGYRLYVSNNPTFRTSDSVLGYWNKDVGNVLTYSVNTNILGGTEYYYKVSAYNASGTSDSSNAKTVLTIPPAPVASVANPKTQISFTANWGTATGATKYYLDVSRDEYFSSYLTDYQNKEVSGISCAVTGLSSGTVYYYRVRAYNSSGTSENSDTIDVTTAPSEPVLLAATNENEASFYANWNPSTTANGYRLDVSVEPDFSPLLENYNDLDVHNVTTYLVSGLSANTTYYYRVRAYNGSLTSENTGSYIAVLTAPSAPASPTVGTGTLTQTSFVANWNSSTGAEGYRLDVSTNVNFNAGTFVTGYEDLGTTDLTYTVTGLTAGTKYYFRVRAYNSGGTSTSLAGTLVTTIPPNPIEKPASSISASGFTANWNEAASATGYLLDVSENSGFTSYVTNYENKPIADVTAPVTGLNAGVIYYYRISAVNAGGESGNSGTISVLTASAAPTATAATSKEEMRFTANWGGVTSATGYLLDVSTNPNCTDSYVDGYNNFDVGNVNSFIVEGLSGGTTYSYRLRAYNVSGNSASYSNIESAKTLSPSPVALPATPISGTSFTAKWNAATGADNYSLYVAEDENFTSPVAGYNPKSVAGLSDAITAALTAGTPYYYKVEANNASGSGTSSNIINVTTLPSAPDGLTYNNVTNNSFSAIWNSTTSATGYRLSVSKSNFAAGDSVAGFWNKNVGNVTTYSVTGLTENTTYYFQVSAYNNSGAGVNSASANPTPTTNKTAPDIPSVKPATSIDSTSFIANWNAAAGAEGYKLDVATTYGFDAGTLILTDQTVGALFYNVSGLTTHGGTYYYRVRATNTNGTSGNSNVVTVKIIPYSPVSSAVTNTTETSFDANWTKSNGAVGHYLDVSTNSGFTAGNFVSGFDSRDVGNVATYTVTGLAGGTTYYFRVRAYNTGGTSVNSEYKTIATSVSSGLFYAANATSITDKKFTANWNTYIGAKNYKLYVSTESDVDPSDILNGVNADTTSYTLGDILSGGTNYYYKIEGYSSTSALLATSGIINVLTAPNPPTLAAADGITETSFNAKWTATNTATGYYLSVSTSSTDFTSGSCASGYYNKYVNNVLTYPVTGLTGGTTYYYKVKAKNGSGEGSYSTSYTTVKTIPHKPVAVNATDITGSGFKANWNASNGADGYNLIVSTNSDLSAPISNTDVGNQTFGNVSGNSGTTYYYGVKAYTTGSGSSDASNIISVLTLPDKPGILTASSIDKTSFTARWNSSASATKYYLDVATSNTFPGAYVAGYQNLDVGNSTTSPVIGLAKGTTYYYRVRAFNASGISENSDIQEVLTFPSEPTVQSATNIQSTSFTANWLAAAGATQYFVDISTTSNFSAGTFTTEGPIANPTVSYNASSLTAANYYYRIKANNANGPSGFSGTMAVLLAPDAPVANSPTSITASSFIAGWNSSSGADGYRIDVCTDAGFTTFVTGYNNKDVGSATSVTVTGLLSGINYYYQVRAYSAGRTSDNSNMITTLTKPAAPIAAAALSITNAGFTANWSEVANTTYTLDVATNSGFTTYFSDYTDKDMGTDESHSLTGLSANTNYYYRIRSHNASGYSSYSGTINVLTAPAIPTTTAATLITNAGFTANWIASAGATGYKLDVSLNSGFTSYVGIYENLNIGNVTTYSISGLSGSTKYYYRLRAYNGSRISGNSGPDNVTTAVNPSGEPTVTAETSIAETSFIANWDFVAGATEYRLDVSTDWAFSAGTFVANYNNRNVGNVNTFSVTGLTGATTYYYRVRSYNVSGTSSNSGYETVLTLTAAPTATAATSPLETSFIANWNATTGASCYYIDVATDDGFLNPVAGYLNKDVLNVTTYTITGLTGGTTYYYRISAYNASGESVNSNTISLLTIPPAPTATAATSLLQTSFTANWNVSAGITTNHYLDVASDNGFTNLLTDYNNRDVSNEATHSISITGLTGGTTYYYRLRSKNTSGTSANSNLMTVLTVPPKPIAKTASSVIGTSFSANWHATKGATKYYLDVSPDNGFGSFLPGYPDKDVGSDTTSSVTGLSENTNYYYRVRANNSSGTTNYSDTITVLTTPPAPVALDATASSEGSFIAHWNSSTGATGYRLDVSTDIGFGSGTFESGYIDTTTGNISTYEDINVGNITTYSVARITSGYTHYYRVRAYNSGGTSANSGIIKVLGVPNANQATAVTITSFSANWNLVTGVLGYRLDVSTSTNFSAGTFLAGFENKDVGTVTTYPISGLTSNTTYYYRVRAYDATTTSGNSNTILVKNLPNPPVATAATNIESTDFTANWNASAGGAAGYKIDVATDAGFTSFVTGYQDKVVYNVTSFNIINLSPGCNYFYRVRGYNSLGDSDNSNSITLITTPVTPSASPASNVTQISFVANWSSTIGASKYFIDVSTSENFADGTFVTGFNNKSVYSSYCSIDGLTPGIVYYYRVRSRYPSISSKYSNTVTVITIPPTPVINAAANVLMQSFTANWDSTKGANGYRIDVSADSGFSANSFVDGYQNKDIGNVNSFSVTDLLAGISYYYRVRAYNSSGISNNSNKINVVTICSIPIAAPASEITQTSFSANWNSVIGATGYRMDVSADSGFSANSFVDGYQNKDIGNANSFSVTNLSAGTSYYYRVRAYNSSGISNNSNKINVVTICSIPVATPASEITQTSFRANWNSVIGAIGYRLDVSTNSSFETGTFIHGYQDKDVGGVTIYSISELSGGTNYYYRIRAYNANGVGLNSNIIATITIPAAPITLTATAITEESFSSNWSIATGAIGYMMDVSTDINFSDNTFLAGYQNKDIGNVTSYSILNLSAGSAYYCRIRAYNLSGISNNSNTLIVVTNSGVPKAEPASEITQTSFRANWNIALGATGYRIEVAEDSLFTKFLSGYNDTTIGAVNNYRITGLKDNQYYYYRICSYNSVGVMSAYSNIINTLTLPNPPAAPIAVVATQIIQTSFTANWNSAENASGYLLDVALDNGFINTVNGYNNLDVKNINSYSVSGLTSGSMYYYRLRSYNRGGTSNNSNVINLTLSLPAPTNLTVKNASDRTLLLSWEFDFTNINVRGFIISRKLSDESSFVQIDSVIGQVTSYVDKKTYEGKSHTYLIRAFNANQATSSNSSQATAMVPLYPPDSLSGAILSAGKIILKWIDKSSVENGFIIEKSEATNLDYKEIARVMADSTVYIDSNIKDNVKYFYRIAAYKDTLFSEYSNEVDVLGIVSGVVDLGLGIPTKYELYQNYPNPFNPSTKIRYAIPKSNSVNIKIFDSIGREVKTLVDKETVPGYYEIIFDAKGLSSGVYFFVIRSGDFVNVKKMLLLR